MLLSCLQITFIFIDRSGGKYGFVDKVIDGIYVHINSVTVQFNSQKFLANLQVRISLTGLEANMVSLTKLSMAFMSISILLQCSSTHRNFSLIYR